MKIKIKCEYLENENCNAIGTDEEAKTTRKEN